MSLTSDDPRDENQLAKIVAAEAAGLTLLAELITSLRKTMMSLGECSFGCYRGLIKVRLRWPSLLDQAEIGLSEDGSLVVPAASYKGRCMRPRSHPSPNAMATTV